MHESYHSCQCSRHPVDLRGREFACKYHSALLFGSDVIFSLPLRTWLILSYDLSKKNMEPFNAMATSPSYSASSSTVSTSYGIKAWARGLSQNAEAKSARYSPLVHFANTATVCWIWHWRWRPAGLCFRVRMQMLCARPGRTVKTSKNEWGMQSKWPLSVKPDGSSKVHLAKKS